MWELDCEESWPPKNWCSWTVVLEKTLESPLDCKEIQPVHPKENQSWMFIGRTDAETETPILQPPDAKNWLIGKDPDAGKDWRREERGWMTGWDGWMVSPTQWIWVWVSSGSWWWTGKPGMLQSMGSQRAKHDWATELTERFSTVFIFHCIYSGVRCHSQKLKWISHIVVLCTSKHSLESHEAHRANEVNVSFLLMF